MHFYTKKIFWIYVSLAAGFLAGMVFILLSGDTYLKSELMWEKEVLQKIKETVIDKRAFFLWLIRRRGIAVFALWLLGYSAFRFPIFLMLSVGIGGCAGIFLTSSVVQMQMTGVLLVLAALFPQIFLYFPAWKMMVEECVQERGEKRSLFLFFSIAACVTAGAVLESCVNPLLLQFVIKKIL